MPNYVYHDLTITGSEEELDRFMAECFTYSDKEGAPKFDFNKLIPEPEHIEKSEEELNALFEQQQASRAEEVRTRPDGVVEVTVTAADFEMVPEWYKWRCKNWGDKWNAATDKLDAKDGKILLGFSTAWAIPWPILNEIAKRFPKLRIEGSIDEGMMNFAGDIVIDGGEIDYTDRSEELHAQMGAAMREDDRSEYAYSERGIDGPD